MTMPPRGVAAILSFVLVPFLGACHVMEPAPNPTPDDTTEAGGAAAVVETLYDLVTFGPGETPDWDAVRALFLDEAVIVLRSSREASTTFSVEGFVADFVRFIETSGVATSGFEERIVALEPLEFVDIAHVLVLYQPRIPGSERVSPPGVDSFQLVRRDGAWRIASIVNDVALEGQPLPAVLRQD